MNAWDVWYQGVYHLTVWVPSLEQAFQEAMQRLGVDSDDGIELWEADVYTDAGSYVRGRSGESDA